MKRIIYLFATILFLVSCDKDAYDIVYKVSGSSSGGFDVTYENSGGGTSQATGVSSGWTYSFEGEADMFVYISAQANGENANVHVEITKGGKTFKESDSSGDYVIASASGSLP